MASNLTRKVVFHPAYDRRNDPKWNFGIHGVEMCFYLIGTEGAIQFVVYTNWQLPHVHKETDASTLAKAVYGSTVTPSIGMQIPGMIARSQ